MRHWQLLAVLLLAAACSGDATAPDPATVEPEPPTPPANRAPVATADSIPTVHLPGPGEAVAVAVGAYFTDPDGDALTFAAASTDTAVVLAAVAGDTVRLTGGGTGGAGTVTVTAADPAGLSARAAVAVAVNRAPVLSGEIPAQSLMAGVPPDEVDVSAYFTDPDGDALAFAAASADTAVVRVSLSGTALTFEARAVGEAAVTVTASDPDSLEARAVFTVEVTEDPDRAALVALYEATDGPNWTNNENWLTDAPLCEWYGVGVTARTYRGGELVRCSRPARLALFNNDLSGPIPAELGDLASLERLDLSENDLSGSIPPELGNLASLEHLSLYNNALSGPIPPELGDLASLRWLNLGDNALTGAIPPELGNLASLEHLSLYSNALSGPIPPELGDLASLEWLGLGDNDLTGAIPPELGNLASLESLSLSNNALTGAIPPELGNLASLQDLLLGYNALSGPIPPELGDLASLEWLTLGNNDLTGAIPPELGNLASLESLSLSNNALSGAIPPELGNLTSLEYLTLGNNDLTGPIPLELGNLARLEWLTLGYNALTGPIPPELGNLARLEWLTLGYNALTGPIPPELGNLASLEYLRLDNNALTGAIPPELGNLASLEYLSLYNNDLTGAIPPELGNLARLEWLRLDNNALCAPGDSRLRAWLAERGAHPLACPPVGVRLLPRALMREDGHGLSLALPEGFPGSATVSVSDPGVVAATVADGWLELAPRSPGRADVEVVPSGGGSSAVAGVLVRPAVGTFGIDIVMYQPAPLGYEEAMLSAADWWAAVLDGTEWPDRRPSCVPPEIRAARADELLISAGSHKDIRGALAFASVCFGWSSADSTAYNPRGGYIGVDRSTSAPGDVDVLRHEIGHVLGLVGWPPRTGLTTGDEEYFTGPRAVEAYRAGGGDPELPGVPREPGSHWHERIGCELMGTGRCRSAVGGMVMDSPDALSLAALADAGYTVDMTKATPWRRRGTAAAAVAGVSAEPFRDVVEVRIVPPPVPE